MADLDDLLVKTSRTFALSIPLLEEPTRRQVTIGYLLFRIADTFEDAYIWSRSKRNAALDRFCDLLERASEAEEAAAVRGWLADPPSEHHGYLELLEHSAEVLAAHRALDPEARRVITEHVVRTARGMAEIVDRTDDSGNLHLDDIPDLKRYCYIVAGIVGEMLTELFLLGAPDLERLAERLRPRAAAFGEALQLVNILKDSADDAREGRCYLPPQVERSRVFELARRDLETASEYVRLLQDNRAPRGTVAFTALPVQLAWATLKRVEDEGPGSKLTRSEVAEIVQHLNLALDQDRPAVA